LEEENDGRQKGEGASNSWRDGHEGEKSVQNHLEQTAKPKVSKKACNKHKGGIFANNNTPCQEFDHRLQRVGEGGGGRFQRGQDAREEWGVEGGRHGRPQYEDLGGLEVPKGRRRLNHKVGRTKKNVSGQMAKLALLSTGAI